MPKTLDERLDSAIASRFTTVLMSNAKWRKTFRTLIDPSLDLEMFRYKEVPLAPGDDEYVHRLDRLPPPAMIGEKAIGDCLSGGPLCYRAIEWIEIPAQCQWRRALPTKQQDIAAAAQALSMVGLFLIELTDAWLRVYGYR
jgi:hypothetical protein